MASPQRLTEKLPTAPCSSWLPPTSTKRACGLGNPNLPHRTARPARLHRRTPSTTRRSPVRVVVAAMRSTTTSWLISGRPRQFNRDVAEQAVLNLVPFAGAGWQVADRDGQAGLAGCPPSHGPRRQATARPSTNSPDVPAPSARPPACEWTSSTATPTSDHPGYRDPPWPPRPPADPDPLRSTAYDRLHAWPAHPAHRSRPGRQIPQARCDRVRRHPGSPGDQRDPATPELSSLCPEYQPAAHPDAATARPPYAPLPPRSPPHHERRSQIRVSTAKSYVICSRVLTTYRWGQPARSNAWIRSTRCLSQPKNCQRQPPGVSPFRRGEFSRARRGTARPRSSTSGPGP